MEIISKKLVVKKSTMPGAGRGLFTKELIEKDTCFLEYKGTITTWKDVNHNEGNNAYVFFVNRNHVVDACNHPLELARFINDARGIKKITGINNNAYYVVIKKRIFVFASKNIEKGSEIFVGYGKDYWDTIRTNIKETAKELAAKKGKK